MPHAGKTLLMAWTAVIALLTLPLSAPARQDPGSRVPVPIDFGFSPADVLISWGRLARSSQLGLKWSEPSFAAPPQPTVPRSADAELDGEVMHVLLLDSESGEPVRGKVEVTHLKGFCNVTQDEERFSISCGKAPIPAGEFASDSAGRAEIRQDEWRNRSGLALADGYAPEPVALGSGHADERDAVVVRLLRAARIEGVVTGSGREGLEVEVERGGGVSGSGPGSATKAPVEEGRYSLGPLHPRRSVHLKLVRGEEVLQVRPLLLEPGETRTLDWSLDATAPLSGVARDEGGRPLAGRELSLAVSLETDNWWGGGIADAVTDEAGRFSFPAVPPGTWYIGPGYDEVNPRRAEDATLAPVPHEVEHEEGPRGTHVDLVLPSARFVRGKVVDTTGTPIVDASVVARGGSSRCWAMEDTDERGCFVVGPISEGEYRVHAQNAWDYDLSRSAPVWARAGDDHLVLVMDPDGGVTVNPILAATRKPIEAQLDYQPHDAVPDQSTQAWGVRSSHRGWRMRPGGYSAVAWTDGGLVGILPRVTATVDDRATLELPLAPGARLRLLNRDDRVLELAVLEEGIRCLYHQIQPGLEKTIVVPPGERVLEWTWADPLGAPFRNHAREDPSLRRTVVELDVGEYRTLEFGEETKEDSR